jgi:hypothetical protein
MKKPAEVSDAELELMRDAVVWTRAQLQLAKGLVGELYPDFTGNRAAPLVISVAQSIAINFLSNVVEDTAFSPSAGLPPLPTDETGRRGPGGSGGPDGPGGLG